MKLPFKQAKRARILAQAIDDINVIIENLHRMPIQFTRGSIYQRLITDLDGARVTARAIHEQELNLNANTEQHNPD